MGEGRSPKRKQGLWSEKGVEVSRSDPAAGKWQDQVSNPIPFTASAMFFPQNPRGMRMDDSKRRWGALPRRVKKEHEAELEDGDVDAKTLGVLGSTAFD